MIYVKIIRNLNKKLKKDQLVLMMNEGIDFMNENLENFI